MSALNTKQRIEIHAVVNRWFMQNFPEHRQYLCHEHPHKAAQGNGWEVSIATKNINGNSIKLGSVLIGSSGEITDADSPKEIASRIDTLIIENENENAYGKLIYGKDYRFSNGDGVQGAKRLDKGAVDLLLTDPPYGISKPYTCEKQVPRRLRTNGRDFIMPKGDFGLWDKPIEPHEWLDIILPKVDGWVVSFCAQAQIGDYQSCLKRHKFVAIGTLVWQKTNPVPFNHRFKPVNAWEAVVVGKRPRAKFNGDGVVHNVFKYKSPSPQKRIHSTQKPLELIQHFVELFSSKGDLVLDPFAGSGTTVIAAVKAGRRAIGYEADEANYQLACERVKGELDVSA